MAIFKSTFAVVLFSILACSFAIPTEFVKPPPPEGSENVGGHTQAVVHLGNLEGRAYFLETSSGKNFAEAKTYCRGQNLTLLTIENQAQVNFLSRALYPQNVLYVHTSLRESQDESMLVFDGTDRHPDPALLAITGLNTQPIHYCVQFRVFSNYLTFFYYSCTDTQVHTVCQTSN